MARPRIPTSVPLPGGYTITVKYVQGESTQLSPTSHAEWDVDAQTIYLRRERGRFLPEDFVHELRHALVDWEDWYLGKSGKKRSR